MPPWSSPSAGTPSKPSTAASPASLASAPSSSCTLPPPSWPSTHSTPPARHTSGSPSRLTSSIPAPFSPPRRKFVAASSLNPFARSSAHPCPLSPFSAFAYPLLTLPSCNGPSIAKTCFFPGAKKTFWISCNVEPEIQHLSLDRRRLPSSFVIRPRDLSRLLSNFQSSLQEITIIATDPSTAPSDAEGEIGGKAVELRSYIDPAKDNSDATLHTQLWIDPAEEFLQYQHVGDPVDVTFGVKELKAFLSFCEGCEVDVHLFFEKAGEPILMAPRFGFDDGTNSDFDVTLVLATMLVSQLNETNASDQPNAVPLPQESAVQRNCSQSRHARASGSSPASEHPSNHTKIWSDLSGPAASEHCRERQAPVEENPNQHMFDFVQRPEMMNASSIPPAMEPEIDIQQPEAHNLVELHGERDLNGNPYSQHHPSNWVGAGEDDDEEDEDELYVQSTPK